MSGYSERVEQLVAARIESMRADIDLICAERAAPLVAAAQRLVAGVDPGLCPACDAFREEARDALARWRGADA